jgi:uncharacterized protein YfaS (alpha-2-macroglobulin family)
VETAADGTATVEFDIAEQLTSYRIMAAAYGEDCFESVEMGKYGGGSGPPPWE